MLFQKWKKCVFCSSQDDSTLRLDVPSQPWEQTPHVRLACVPGSSFPAHRVLLLHSSVRFRFIISFFRTCLIYLFIQQTARAGPWARHRAVWVQGSGKVPAWEGSVPHEPSMQHDPPGLWVLFSSSNEAGLLCKACWGRSPPYQDRESLVLHLKNVSLCSGTFDAI